MPEAVKPTAVVVEYDHTSHATQHEPFTDDPTHYGMNDAAVGLKWQPVPHVNVQLSEGVSLDRHYRYSDGTQAYGSFMGPREEFSGRVQYEIPLR